MSPIQVAQPPEPLNPAIDILGEDTLLYRVHPLQFEAPAFNPGLAPMVQATQSGQLFPVARFSFFLDDQPEPAPVPVLYAAASENAAIWEVILRDREVHDTSSVPTKRYEHLALSYIRPTRELRIGSLAGADMVRFGMNQDDLMDPEPPDYHQTIPWARAAWASGLDGIKYVSKRDRSSTAYVFFESQHEEDQMFTLASGADPVRIFGDFADGFEWLSERMGRWNLHLDR